MLSGVGALFSRGRSDVFAARVPPTHPQGEWDFASSLSSLSSPPLGAESGLRVLTANVWGVPTSPHTRKRLRTLGTLFPAHDVVCLQEVWHERDRLLVRDLGLDAGLSFFHAFSHGSGVGLWPGQNGTGLIVLSRYPIVQVGYHRYSTVGRPYAFHQADYYGAKGIGRVRIAAPAGAIDVYNTHLLAQYDPGKEDQYPSTRVAQAFEGGAYVASTAGCGAYGVKSPPVVLVVVVGDFNATPDSLVVGTFRTLAGLRDVYGDAFQGEGDPGYTGTGPGNVPQRMDYVFYADTPRRLWEVDSIEVIDSLCVPNPDHSAPKIPVSDHAPISVSFRSENGKVTLPRAPPFPVQWREGGSVQAVMLDAVETMERGVEEIDARRTRHKSRFWAALAGLFLLLALSLVASSRYGYTAVAILTHGASAGQLFGSLLVYALTFLVVGFLPLMFLCVCLAAYICVEFFLAWYVCADELRAMSELLSESRIWAVSLTHRGPRSWM